MSIDVLTADAGSKGVVIDSELAVDDIQLLGEVLERCTPFGEAGGCVEARARRPDVVEPEETTGLQSIEKVFRNHARAVEMLEYRLHDDQVEFALDGGKGVVKILDHREFGLGVAAKGVACEMERETRDVRKHPLRRCCAAKGAPRPIHGRDPAPVLENPEVPTEEVEEDLAAPHRMQTHAVSGVEGLEEIGRRLPVG